MTRRRVRSLTSIMSSTGNPELPPSTDAAIAAMLSPAATNREEAIERTVQVGIAIGAVKLLKDQLVPIDRIHEPVSVQIIGGQRSRTIELLAEQRDIAGVELTVGVEVGGSGRGDRRFRARGSRRGPISVQTNYTANRPGA